MLHHQAHHVRLLGRKRLVVVPIPKGTVHELMGRDRNQAVPLRQLEPLAEGTAPATPLLDYRDRIDIVHRSVPAILELSLGVAVEREANRELCITIENAV